LYDRGQRASAREAPEQVVAFKNSRFEEYAESGKTGSSLG